MISSAVVSYAPQASPTIEDPAPVASAGDVARGRATPPPVFAPDTADGDDKLGRAGVAALIAQFCCHEGVGTPAFFGILGSSGSGKSSLMRRIFDRIDALGGAQRRDSKLPGVLTVRIDTAMGGDPARTLMSRLFGALGANYPALAEDAVYAGGDPVKAARAAGERVNDLRRQLDAERQTLDQLDGRRVRLTETVLFHSPGSRIEGYGRQNRARIEGRLKAFGIAGADPMETYKEFVREAAETAGGTSRVGLALRALWGFKGQGTLLILAVLFLLAGWGCDFLATHQDAWTAWLEGFGDRMAGPTAWAQSHAPWLMPLAHAAFALAALAVLVDIVRAIRFLQPVFRGASLLGADLEGRRKDLDGMVAHQTRRVDHLAAELEVAVRGAETAERRVEARKAAGLLAPSLSLDGEDLGRTSPQETVLAFLAGLRSAMDGPAPSESLPTPGRIVVGLDELDALPPSQAATWLDTAHRLLSSRHFVTVAALGRDHVRAGFSETDPALAASRFKRCLPLTYDLDAEAEIDPPPAAPHADDPGLDRPWLDVESQIVAALEGLAGRSPRSRKGLVNRYRVARADPRLADAAPAELAGLALALALAEAGRGHEIEAFRDGREPAFVGADEGGLQDALVAARRAIGTPFSAAEARRGFDVARLYAS